MIKVGKHGQNAGIQVLANALAGRPEAFTNSSNTFRGKYGQSLSLGSMPSVWQPVYDNAKVIYTVFSYHTPIAWLDSDGNWTVPAVTYSMTTSQHQSKLRAALTYNGTTYTEKLPEKPVVVVPDNPEASLFTRSF